VVGGLLVVTLAGCSQASNGPKNANSATTATATSAARTTAKPTSKPTHVKPPPLHRATLPSDCTLLLTHGTVNRALGKAVTGKTIYIKGLAEPKIGRTGRVTCRYGVKGKSIPIEAGISGYRTASQASTRVRVTVAAERDAGARVSTTTIGGQPATILLGKNGSLLVYCDSNRTVAVTLDRGVGGTKVATVLKTLADAVSANLP
jgi:hypothetical protein